jgi:hypothetical protein
MHFVRQYLVIRRLVPGLQVLFGILKEIASVAGVSNPGYNGRLQIRYYTNVINQAMHEYSLRRIYIIIMRIGASQPARRPIN